MPSTLDRTLQTGWFALHPTSGPRLAYAELTARVGHSARAEIYWESPDADDGVYNGIDLHYMRSRATVSMSMCLDPFDGWTREGASKVPPERRPQMRALVDGPDTDLNELFTHLVADDPALIAALDITDLGDAMSMGVNLPPSNDIWRPAATSVTIESIRPWW